MFVSAAWLVGTGVLIILAAELASDLTESNLSYTRSKWLGAYSSEAGDISAVRGFG